jgi:drug/metabolite transporter (DMT)-like permease
MDQQTRRGALEMAVAMTISGTIGWVVVSSGQRLSDLLFWRCALGFACLLAWCWPAGLLRGLNRRVLLTAGIGGVAIVLNWLLLFASFRHASISIATAVYQTQPFMLVGLGALFLGEKVGAGRLAWLAVAFGGVLLVVQGRPGGGAPDADPALGVLMALGAAALYAVAAFTTKKLTGTAPHLIALVQVGVGALMLLPFVLGRPLPSQPRAWMAFAAMGVLYTGLMYILLYDAIQRLPTILTGALSFLYPLVAMLVDHVAFDQQLDLSQWLGAAAVLVAAAGLNLGGTRQPARPPGGATVGPGSQRTLD